MQSESDLLEAQTLAFIKTSPTDLVFRRKSRSSDGKGGKKTIGETRIDSQTVRVVGLASPEPIVTPNGREYRITKNVVGMPNLDVAEGDLFEYDGNDYEVVSVQREPSWRTSAGAVRRGG